jgi:hypothetical protein
MNRGTTLALTVLSLLFFAAVLPARDARASTMSVSYQVFPTAKSIPIGTEVPCLPGPLHVFGISPGSTATLPAPGTVPPQGGNPVVQCLVNGTMVGYTFEFWDAAGTLEPGAAATCTAPSDGSNFSCTAYYFEDVGTSAPVVTTYAFSLNENQVIPGQTPIASVTGAPWTPPSTTVNVGDSAVVITADTVISGFGRFKSWMPIGASQGTTVNNAQRTLRVPAKGGAQAIAFYGIPVPDPCATIRAELSNLNNSCLGGEVPINPACTAELNTLRGELLSCEKLYGEGP